MPDRPRPGWQEAAGEAAEERRVRIGGGEGDADSAGGLDDPAGELGIRPSMLRRWRAATHGTVPRTQAGAATSALAIPRLPSLAEQAAEIARLKRGLDRTHQERDVLKKSYRHRLGSPEMRFRFIEDHRQEHPVQLMCHVLGVSPSGYYARRLAQRLLRLAWPA